MAIDRFKLIMVCLLLCIYYTATVKAQVGINASNPEVELHVMDDSNEGLVGLRLQPYGVNSDSTIEFFEHTAPAMSLYYSGVQNDLRLYDLTTDSSRVTFLRSGNVGIGMESDPTAFLEVAGDQRHRTIRASESPGGDAVGRIEIGYDGGDDFGRIQVWDGDPGVNAPADLILQTAGGNVGIGTSQPLAAGGKILYFGDNVISPDMANDTAGLYAKDVGGTVQLFSVDENNNSTQISPHDPITGEWVFYSKNIKTGRVVRVNMEKLVKKVEELTGEKFFEEWIEK